jgi:NCAIR mutase (PurE)-related protein
VTGAALLRDVLALVRAGELGIEEALGRLAHWPAEDLGFAQLDHHRALRLGFAESVYGPGKSPDEVAAAVRALAAAGGAVLATRLDDAQAAAVRAGVPGAVWHDRARMISVGAAAANPAPEGPGVAVVAAGTADLQVAEEAAVTAEVLGSGVTRIYDVGVAGLHRLLSRRDDLAERSAVVAVAGMEGALPGVVAGLVRPPVIAVPTSVGYGAGMMGLAALLTMLNACAPGIAVVNIDNGYGAGYMAALIDQGART